MTQVDEVELPEDWKIKNVYSIKFAPTSAGIERSFSKLNQILNDRRSSLTVENL